ncbi:MAG: hypothetical protein ABIY71_10890, partial [Flavobacteriales bacterium]
MSGPRYTPAWIVFIFILACVSASAQPGFIRTYAPPPGTIITGADASPDGGMVYCGAFGDRGFLMHLDASGNTVWARTYSAVGTFDSGTFGANWQISFQGVAALGNGTFIVVGSGRDTAGVIGTQQLTLLCDALGNPVWSSSQGSFHSDSFSMADVESPSAILIAGMTGGLGGSRAYVTRCDPLTGEFGDGRLLRPFSAWSTYAEALALDHCDDGGVALSGGFIGTSEGSCISKMDSALNPIWEHGWSNFIAVTLAGLADGSLVAAGDSVVARFLPSGLVDWSLQLIAGHGGIRAMQVRPDGHILLAGWSEPADPYSWLILLDPSGSEVWSRRYGNSGDQFKITGLDQLASGGLRLTGSAGSDVLLVATDDMGLAGSCTYASLVHTLAPMALVALPDPIS